MMKKLLITSLAAMSLLAFGACGGDDEDKDKDKDKKECTSSADCADGKICSADGKCVDGAVTTDCTSDADCAAGETCNTATGECEAGAVTTDCTSDADCATGETCNAATGECESGTVVVPDLCADVDCGEGKYCAGGDCYAEGDACDSAAFTENCDGEVVVYCYDGAVDLLDCSTGEGYSCEIMKATGIADCFSAEDACAAGDETINVCAYYGGYSAESSCQESNGGEYYYYYTDATGETWEECVDSCDDSTGLCVEIIAPEGWTCDASYYGDGECDCGCGIQDSDCADATYASCVYNDCETGHPDPAAPTTCVTVTGEGDACDSASADKCVDNVMLYCSSNSNTYVGWACGTDSCLTDSAGTAGCYGAADACQENDPAKYECGAYLFWEISYEYVCTQMSDDNYYYMTGTNNELCESTCDATTGLCVEVPKPEGWTCPGSYYGDSDCDCGCGIQDTDCADASATSCVYEYCEEGQVVNATQNWICE